MTKQCPSCGGDCGRTKNSGCQYGLPKPRHKNYEVDNSGWAAYNLLVDRLLAGTPHVRVEDYLKGLGK